MRVKRTPTILRDRARSLRRRQTSVEKKLWSRLRARQLHNAKFRRQHPIARYIVDFCCLEARLIVELDGGQHASQTETDRKRTDWLASQGFRVLRFWDNEVVESIDAVVDRIAEYVKPPSP